MPLRSTFFACREHDLFHSLEGCQQVSLDFRDFYSELDMISHTNNISLHQLCEFAE